jgi:hypothetical protein
MAKTKKQQKTPEERLADYWRKKANLKFSDFDSIVGKVIPDQRTREPAYALRTNDKDLASQISAIGQLVVQGYPLSKREYHIAIGMGWIMGETPYEEFYKTHWYETATQRGYGKLEDAV